MRRYGFGDFQPPGYFCFASSSFTEPAMMTSSPCFQLAGVATLCLEVSCSESTVRNVFIVGPDKKLKLILVYPMTTGRNFDEVLRVLDSLQLTAKHKVATPANWKQGEDVIIAGSVSDDDAKKVYPQGWKAPRPYLRIVPQPR